MQKPKTAVAPNGHRRRLGAAESALSLEPPRVLGVNSELAALFAEDYTKSGNDHRIAQLAPKSSEKVDNTSADAVDTNSSLVYPCIFGPGSWSLCPAHFDYRMRTYVLSGALPTVQAAPPDPVAHASSHSLRADAEQAHPGFEASWVWDRNDSPGVVEIWLERPGEQLERLANSFTGEDLGPAVPTPIRVLNWLKDFHVRFTAGSPGQRANGIGHYS
jgi:hypothetical protein